LLTAPTETLRVNDASTGATTSWIFVHIFPFMMRVITTEYAAQHDRQTELGR
jgi:hypothetical protein